nr:hypothetical protein BaRGS_009872 [Batillaria attramentaria]
MWETQKLRVIKAGTLPRLVEALATVRGELDSSYMNVFLATYRTFATPLQLLQAVVDRTLKCVLSVWLDTYPEDFRESPDYPCLTLLESFARELIPDSDLATRAKQRISKYKEEDSGNAAENIEFRFSICDEVDHMIDADVPKPLSFMDISPRTFAEQLTFRDAELRELKNFSSLRAILSGLQSHPVYRLRKCWAAVPKDMVVLFEELSDIFSGENNQINSRELLMKEATAKFPDLDSQNKTLKRKNLQKRRSWIDNVGTVPYLGTFLTDLTMLDTAMSDVTEDGLINFEKRRREFEVLAQLRLLQSAAQIYTLQCEPRLGHKPSKYEGAPSAARLGFFCGAEERNSISSIPDTIAASIGPLVNSALSQRLLGYCAI